MDIEEQKRIPKNCYHYISRSININGRVLPIIQSSFNKKTELNSINSTLAMILGLVRKVKRIWSHII